MSRLKKATQVVDMMYSAFDEISKRSSLNVEAALPHSTIHTNMLGFDSSSSQDQPAQTTSATPIPAEDGKEVIGKMADSVGAAEVLTVDGARDADRVSPLKHFSLAF